MTLSTLRDASKPTIWLALASSIHRGLRRVTTPASARTRWIRPTGVCCTAPLLSRYCEALWHGGDRAGLSPNYGMSRKPCMWPIPRFEDSSDLSSWNGGQSKPGLPGSCRASFEAVPDREVRSEADRHAARGAYDPTEAKKPPGGGFSTNRLLELSGAGAVPELARSQKILCDSNGTAADRTRSPRER